MDRLKKIINQLDKESFAKIELELSKPKSENYLLLLQSYRNTKLNGDRLLTELSCSENALYVLKSRLYNKIQNYLLENDINQSAQQPINRQVPLLYYLYEYPRETALAILHKIEQQYAGFDTHEELIQVYSVLKKAYYYSDKYYHYSQLYNKQIAYAISVEKAEDTLFNFNKALASYYLSRSEKDEELVIVLLQQAENLYTLNKCHRLELIRNIIVIQVMLYTPIMPAGKEQPDVLLQKCDTLMEQYRDDKQICHFKQVLIFLKFEYYTKISLPEKLLPYFNLIHNNEKMWLLHNNTCLAIKFFLSKINLYIKLDKKQELENGMDNILFDKHDFYSRVGFTLYRSVAKLYNNKLAEAIIILAELVNDTTLKDFFYIEVELKLSLAFFYFKQNEYRLASMLLQSIYRKANKTDYKNAKAFILLLNLFVKGKTKVTQEKINRAREQFYLHNTGNYKILEFLQPEIDLISLHN